MDLDGSVRPGTTPSPGEDEPALSLWVVRAWDGEPHDPQPHEHDELRWVGVADLPRMCLAHPADVEALRRAVELRSTAISGE